MSRGAPRELLVLQRIHRPTVQELATADEVLVVPASRHHLGMRASIPCLVGMIAPPYGIGTHRAATVSPRRTRDDGAHGRRDCGAITGARPSTPTTHSCDGAI